MESTTLKKIICPYCGQSFKINLKLMVRDHSLIYGSVYCVCDEFPVLEGILYLKRDLAKQALTHLYRHNLYQAVTTLLMKSKLIKLLCKLPGFTYFYGNPKLWLWIGFRNLARLDRLFRFNYLTYFFNRHLEKASLLFFLPLSFLRTLKQPFIWLNVGAGISNYYPELFTICPKVEIIAVDISFTQLFFSRLFFPNTHTAYICADIATGYLFESGKVQVITLNDTFPFIENQRQVIQMLTSGSMLHPTGILLMSSIPEHYYLPSRCIVYPIAISLLAQYFPTPPLFVDDQSLIDCLDNPSLTMADVGVRAFESPFRYSVIWSQTKEVITGRESYPLYIPANLRKQVVYFWKDGERTWRNAVC